LPPATKLHGRFHKGISMTKTLTWTCAVAALLLCGCIAASAQNAPDAEKDKGQEPPSKADAGTTLQLSCIGEEDGFKMNGKQPIFQIALENKCEQRMKCKVFVYITSAKGPVQGRGTIVLAPKSAGAAAKGIYTIKTKESGGSSLSTRECKVLP
jgi:hypothetical protein